MLVEAKLNSLGLVLTLGLSCSLVIGLGGLNKALEVGSSSMSMSMSHPESLARESNSVSSCKRLSYTLA